MTTEVYFERQYVQGRYEMRSAGYKTNDAALVASLDALLDAYVERPMLLDRVHEKKVPTGLPPSGTTTKESRPNYVTSRTPLTEPGPIPQPITKLETLPTETMTDRHLPTMPLVIPVRWYTPPARMYDSLAPIGPLLFSWLPRSRRPRWWEEREDDELLLQPSHLP